MGVESVSQTSGGKRMAKRARVLLAARLETPSGEFDARLRDLSRKGALVECAKPIPVGSEVTFKRGSTIVPARVAWAGSGRVGLEFHYLIDEQEVLVQLGRKPAGPRKSLRAGGTDLPDHDDRRQAEAWAATVGLSIPRRNF